MSSQRRIECFLGWVEQFEKSLSLFCFAKHVSFVRENGPMVAVEVKQEYKDEEEDKEEDKSQEEADRRRLIR